MVRLTYDGGMFLIGKAENTHCEWLMDTGCTTTLLSTRLYQKMAEDEKPDLQTYSGKLLSADGSEIKSVGVTQMNIRLGKQQFRQRTIVCDITNDGLIGLDFLKNHDVQVNFSKNQVMCKGEILPSKYNAGTPKACRVYLAESTVLPPASRTIVQGKSTHPLATGDWITEPLNNTPGKKPVLVAKTLIKGCGTTLPIEILNPTDDCIFLHEKTNLAITSRIRSEDVSSSITEEVKGEVCNAAEEKEMEKSEKLPDELRNLMSRMKVSMTDEEKEKVEKMLKTHREVFACSGESLGRTEITKHSIKTRSEMPIKQHVRRPPFHLKEEADGEVQKMLKQDVIEPSESPWASPVVLVRKKDNSLRYCIDYRKLNSVTVKDSYPLPRIDESLDSLGGSKFFSTLDLASGYWQIELDEDAKQKSAFCTTSGLYQFKVMPFGLTNAPATFQRLMERVLSSLQWQICLIYIDDIIIFSQTLDEHITRLDEILRRLRKAGLKLKPKKCDLFQHKVTYLGHVVGQDGIETDPSKIDKIKEWPEPTTVTEIKAFLGLCSYYRRFVKNFSSIARPLVKLTEKDVEFKWSSDQETAFQTLKRSLMSSPILSYPQAEGEFVLDTDACDFGIGAVLSQVQNGEEKVISYASRTLGKAERKYCVTRKELLAVIYFTQHFKHFLYGRHFTVRTDHGSLRWLRNFKNPEGQIARWIEILETYDFTIEHRPGVKHGNADALSRRPCKQCGRDDQEDELYQNRRNSYLYRLVNTKDSQDRLNKISHDQGRDTKKQGHGEDEEEKLQGQGGGAQSHEVREGQGHDERMRKKKEEIYRDLESLAEDWSMLSMDEMKEDDEKSSKCNQMMEDEKQWSSRMDKEVKRKDEPEVDEDERMKRRKMVHFRSPLEDWNILPSSKSTLQPVVVETVKKKSQDKNSILKQRNCIAPVRTRSQKKDPLPQCSNWLSSMNLDQKVIQSHQEQDPVTSEVIMWIEKGQRPEYSTISCAGREIKFLWGQFNSLQIQNNLLVRKLKTFQDVKIQIYIPPSLRDEVLDKCHGTTTSAHLGGRRSLARLKRNFIWSGMRADIEEYVKNCQKCAMFMPTLKKRKGAQRPLPVGLPMERVYLDIVGPFPVTPEGNKYILVVTDGFTKFVQAYPMKNMESRTVADILVREFITIFGNPMHIHSDQGTQFEAELFQKMCELLGITKTRTTPFRPQSDGQSERNIRTLTNLLAKAVTKQDNWDYHIPFVLMAYRSTPHEATKMTPNKLMFGRENYMPMDILLPPSPDQEELTSTDKYADQLKITLNNAYKLARENLKHAAVRQKKLYDLKKSGKSFAVGDIVWMANLGARRKGISPKFQPKWKGPYLIVQQFNDVLVEVMKSHCKTSVVHTDHLKKWFGKKNPPWIHRAKKQLVQSQLQHE